jgi:hypothetical protein
LATLLPLRPHWPLTAAATLALAFLSTTAQAQSPASVASAAATAATAQSEEIAHTVVAGETLEGLAKAYLSSVNQWPLLQARNKVADPKRLKPGSTIWIPVRLQPEESATVEFVQGLVTAHIKPSGTPEPVTQGGTLSEGTTLNVGPDAFVSVRLADGTVVRVQAQSEVELRQLRRRGRAGSVQSAVEIRSGSVESTVPRTQGPLSRFEIRTPRAVTSVRGTQFRVSLENSGQTVASVLAGSVAVQSQTEPKVRSGGTLLAPGQGLVVSSNGSVGTTQTLLPQPDTSAVPALATDANILAFEVPLPPGAARQVAQIARDADFTQVLLSGSFDAGRLAWATPADGRYYLSVRAVDSAGIPGLPTQLPFTIKARPVAPLYQQPSPGAIVATGAGELQCTNVPKVRWYRIQIAADAEFKQTVRDEQRLSECRLPLQALPPGHYFWRIASVIETADGQPDQGPFAQPQAFTVADRPAALSLAAMKAQDGEPKVSLHWSAQAQQRFRLQLAPAANPEFDKLSRDTELATPDWSASDLRAGEYLVRIQVLDPSGLKSDFSPARKLRVGTGFSTGNGLPVFTSSGEPVERP